jgi:rRNA maturation endonuclease Nob1
LQCPRCTTPYEEGDTFCKKCGWALTAPGTKTVLSPQTMTCPSCLAAIPADSTFCPKCGSAVSLPGTTDATVLVQTPTPPGRLKDVGMSSMPAETEAATSREYTCPACHIRVQLGPEDQFCGNCGHSLTW